MSSAARSAPPDPAPAIAPDAEPQQPGFARRLRVPLLLLALVLLHHLGSWLYLGARRGVPLLDALNRWDSALYSTVATRGAEGPLWAFLPLYPAAVRAGLWLLPGGLAPQVVGLLLSTLALLLFVLAVTWAQGRVAPGDARAALLPRGSWGWFVLLYWPVSYTLHSHHTEGLFLLLSFGALWAAAGGRAVVAGLLAAACVWTRNQGVLVAVTAALLGLPQWRRFLLTGGLAFAGFLALLGYEAAGTGDPLAFLHAQGGWTHAASVGDVLRTFWFGNPWQNTNTGSLQRHAWYLLALALVPGLWRRSGPLGLYALLSLALILLQGELVNAFRYTVVLFPLAFYAGERLERLPPWARGALALGLVWLNHELTRRYALGQWAY
ncbi:hypothetical protein FGE12_05045 [Aggregicoccus sp. 17bor-14]|uniref:hypothetical protein n=1 Tax=Myxococcaceae TaxID=31 RepID=UPI00129CDB12|nr:MULTISPECIES: hypothetical protein [Myxococcaceae]MBF5041747.1 hypothetical protein [Simulacricoccus sp. 17bor-14]MRI87528.1 hypothetical protein [Aggregicoccus sp. 17bor-14]